MGYFDSQSTKCNSTCLTRCVLLFRDEQGGEGVGWHDVVWDTSTPNARAGTTVNVDSANNVGYVADAEWLSYSVTSKGGLFSVSYSMAGAPPSPVTVAVFLTTDTSCRYMLNLSADSQGSVTRRCYHAEDHTGLQ